MKKGNIPIKMGPISPMHGMAYFIINDPNGIDIQIFEQNHG